MLSGIENNIKTHRGQSAQSGSPPSRHQQGALACKSTYTHTHTLFLTAKSGQYLRSLIVLLNHQNVNTAEEETALITTNSFSCTFDEFFLLFLSGAITLIMIISFFKLQIFRFKHFFNSEK